MDTQLLSDKEAKKIFLKKKNSPYEKNYKTFVYPFDDVQLPKHL